ncbi:hypothetical protein BDF22DRAFT_739501 [Syncephalis plumigaleata]|nr:hypothetical protein BDF22DRAFT_739501 [Syncephalis plumigaleata]
MEDLHYWGLVAVVATVLGVLAYRRLKERQGYLRVGNNSTFQQDIEDGLTSSNFDLNANVLDGDTRPGLDADEIRRIMKDEGCSFDEARLLRQQRILLRHNIDPRTGLPRDPKLVTFG